jgi:hypothetical protein
LYRHFLTTAQFTARFGQAWAVIRGVDAALRDVGLPPGQASANRLVIPVATTVGRASAGLHIGFERYRFASGRVALANTSAPLLPAGVAQLTQAVLGLNDLITMTPTLRASSAPVRARPAVAARSAAAGPQPCPAAVSERQKLGGWTYDQLAKAYSFTGMYASGHRGAGVTVALFELENWSDGDIRAFQTCYGTHASVTLGAKVDGGATGSPGAEATADIETVIGLAPAAKILVYEAPEPDVASYPKSAIDEYTRIVDDDKAQVLSTSWGLCEPELNNLAQGLIQSEDTVFEQAAAEGMSVFAAAGDTGSEGCYKLGASMKQLAVLDPASQPFVTSVGGTDLTAVGPPPAETVWNQTVATRLGAGGGGISSVWPMPSWQAGPGVISKYSAQPCPHTPTSYCREVPDVSASAAAAHRYVIYFGKWTGFYGTSAAAPLWAALLADIDSLTSPATRAGFLNPQLYALPRGAFNDIVSGNNDYTQTHHGRYPATRGFDMASGLGSPIGAKLAAALQTSVITAPMPAGTSSDPRPSIFYMACPSITVCVAAGSYYDSSGHAQGLLLTGSGTSWTATEAPLPAGASATLGPTIDALACPSTTVCVAAGSYYDSSGQIQGLLLTGSGTAWTATEAPLPANAAASPGATITSVACPSTTECVAVGGYTDTSGGGQGLLLTGAGTSWTPADAPVPANAAAGPRAYIFSVACPSTDKCAAAGEYTDSSGNNQGLLVTRTGTSWAATEASLPAGAAASPGAVLLSVACSSATVCIAAGSYYDSSETSQGLLLTGSGNSWTPAEAPVPANADPGNPGSTLDSITCAAGSSCVATGSYDDSSGTLQRVLLTGSGTSWTATEAPMPAGASSDPRPTIQSVACPATTRCVAVGSYYDTSDHPHGLVLTGSGATWTPVEGPLPAGAAAGAAATISSLACPSPTTCTAGGSYLDSSGNGQGMLLIWPG